MNRRFIFSLFLATFLMLTGCDSGMLADHPIEEDGAKLEIALITSAVAYFNQDTVTLSGRVVLCSLNNNGNPNVRVALDGAFENRTTYTDSNGDFSFNDIRPGDFVLSASRQEYNFVPAQQTVTLTQSGISNVNFQTMVTWEKTIGGSGWEKANSVVQTNDCSIIAAGYSDSHNTIGNKDFMIVKMNPIGNEEWSKTFGGSSSEIAYSISNTSNNDFVIACGYSFSNTMGIDDILVTKINVNNNTDGEWQNLYGGAGQDVAYSITNTTDNGFIVVGYTDSEGAGETDIKVIKLDSDGTIVWPAGVGVYGGGHSDSANAIIEVSSGGYIIAGNKEDAAGNYDIWIIRVNSDGSVVWDETFNESDFDDAYDIQETSDGGFVVAGYANNGSGHYWLIKLDVSGNIEWERLDDGEYPSALYSIRQSEDGGYIAAGSLYSYATTDNDMFVMKLDTHGILEWEKTFDGDYHHEDVARSIRQTSDGGYIVAGYTTTYENKTDMWIIKLNREGNIIP